MESVTYSNLTYQLLLELLPPHLFFLFFLQKNLSLRINFSCLVNSIWPTSKINNQDIHIKNPAAGFWEIRSKSGEKYTPERYYTRLQTPSRHLNRTFCAGFTHIPNYATPIMQRPVMRMVRKSGYSFLFPPFVLAPRTVLTTFRRHLQIFSQMHLLYRELTEFADYVLVHWRLHLPFPLRVQVFLLASPRCGWQTPAIILMTNTMEGSIFIPRSKFMRS